MTARQAALGALKSVRMSGVFAEEAVAAACSGLEGRERALASRLVFGVVQNERYLDWCIGRLTGIGRLEPRVLDILRMGAYQLLFLERVPASAAVNEAVDQTKRIAPRAAGLVNAVLRKLAAQGGMPEPPDGEQYLSIRYSLPQWFADRITELLGREGAEAFARACNDIPPVTLHRNPLKEADTSLLAAHPWLDGAFEYRGELSRIDSLRDGGLLVADAAAALAVMALAPQPGEAVWDVCAAPGGKALLSAFAMRDTGRLLATDLSEKRLGRLLDASRLCGVGMIRTETGDARTLRPDGAFDAVLCDVPCSGFGVLRKKPDIRRKTERDIAHLPQIQLDILRNAATHVAPGGRLVYCTCTVLPEENGAVCDAFLSDNPGFAREPFALPAGDAGAGDVTLWPHVHGTDGFYICRMRRS